MEDQRDGRELEKQYDIVVDAMAPKGREVVFQPAGGIKIRSEIRLEHVSGKSNGALAYIGGRIPGQRMYIKLGKSGGSCKIVDCLNLAENSSIDTKLRELTTRENFRRFKYDIYVKDIDFSISKKEMPQWLFWIRRLVDHGRFQFVKGESKVPSLYKIVEDAGGQIQISEDRGISPKKDVQPFNVISLDDLPEEVGAES